MPSSAVHVMGCAAKAHRPERRASRANPDYMAHALSMFKAGTRKSAIMLPIAAGLSEQQMHELAAYFSQLQAPFPRAVAAMMSEDQVQASAAYLSRSGSQ